MFPADLGDRDLDLVRHLMRARFGRCDRSTNSPKCSLKNAPPSDPRGPMYAQPGTRSHPSAPTRPGPQADATPITEKTASAIRGPLIHGHPTETARITRAAAVRGLAPALAGTIVRDYSREVGDAELDQCPHWQRRHATRFKKQRWARSVLRPRSACGACGHPHRSVVRAATAGDDTGPSPTFERPPQSQPSLRHRRRSPRTKSQLGSEGQS